jgi:hypothetical protein
MVRKDTQAQGRCLRKVGGRAEKLEGLLPEETGLVAVRFGHASRVVLEGREGRPDFTEKYRILRLGVYFLPD